jgi:hypothetical protein
LKKSIEAKIEGDFFRDKETALGSEYEYERTVQIAELSKSKEIGIVLKKQK